MKKRFLSVLAALLAAVLLLSCSGANLFAFAAAEKQTVNKPALIKSFITYQLDYASKKWVKTSKTDFQYENGYPVLKDLFEYTTGATTRTTFNYKFFKNGKPSTRTDYKDGELEWIVTYNKDGTINRQDNKSKNSKLERIYQYADGAPYFTAVLHNSIYYNAKKPKVMDYTMEEIDSISVKTWDNGLLKKTTNTGLYANWNNGEEKNWERFNGTYTVNYDKNGIANNTSAIYRFGPSGKELSFKLTVKDGRITQIVQRRWNSVAGKNGAWENNLKFTFQYTDIKIDKARYSLMINDSVLTASSTYYIYNWY